MTDVPIFSEQPVEGADQILSFLVELAQRGIEPGITLTVPGGHISGVLIGGKRYFELMRDAMDGATFTGSDEGEVLRETMKNFYGSWTSIYDAPDSPPEDWLPDPPTYIHLRDASWIVGGPRVAVGGGALWRGKLALVSGFAMTQITA